MLLSSFQSLNYYPRYIMNVQNNVTTRQNRAVTNKCGDSKHLSKFCRLTMWPKTMAK